MFRLKALIWKCYKVRLRSPLLTTLDVAGPIVTIVVYLLLKFVIGSYSETVPLESAGGYSGLFRFPAGKPLSPNDDLRQFMCPKVLFYSEASPATTSDPIQQSLGQTCGLELVSVSGRAKLVEKLRTSLEQRIAFRPQPPTDLNRSNATVGCLSLPGTTEPIYQAGIIYKGQRTFEIFTTDSASNRVINQPYTQGSTYNEFRFPQGDMNTGVHLLEICVAMATDHSPAAKGEQPSTTTTTTTMPQLGDGVADDVGGYGGDYRAKHGQVSGGGGGGSSGGGNLIHGSSGSSTSNTTTSRPFGASLKLRVKAFPVAADPMIIPVLFMVFQLAGNLCNAVATVMRISEDNEIGLHRYIRIAGVPASLYWLSQMLIATIHMFVQSLVMAVLLAIPTSSYLFDPIQQANIAMRWLLILSYSLAVQAHALFVGYMFARTSHAILVTCLLAVNYCMYPFTYLLQWSPYGFASFRYFIDFTLLNPVSNYEALLLVVCNIYMQTNEPLQFSHLPMKIIGGGISDWSVGSLWALLLGQGLFWFVATVLFDQWFFSSARSPLGLLANLFNELCCCNKLGPSAKSGDSPLEEVRSSKSAIGGGGLHQSNSKSRPAKDPNRVCCSVRHVTVLGPTIMMAHTRGDPLKMTPQQLKQLRAEESAASKTHQYLIERSQRPTSAGNYKAGSPVAAPQQPPQQEEPILLDEAMQQHIIWHQTRVSFENLSVDFRFNQVSFVLGQTDLKELFFATLLGLRPTQSGHIVLDGTKYTPATLALARPQIGYLAEREIFLNEMTIFENLQFFGSLRDPSYTRFDSESLFVLSLLHLTSRKDNLPVVLTSRSARKLALATAAVGHTKLLLLVEPTLSLRWKPRCQVLNLLKKYKSIRSIVVDTSDVDEATAFGDRVLLFRNGQVDLDGTPERLKKKLGCGHWLVFEPTDAGASKNIPTESIKALEALTNQLFKQDKLERLDATRRSVYQELMKSATEHGKDTQSHGGGRPRPSPAESKASTASADAESKATGSRQLSHEKLQKATVILKVQQSEHSSQALCSVLKLFAQHNINGFRLAELTYESLEDVLVLRMSKAMYPDLPPDLLLSLQHRTQAGNSQQLQQKEQSQVSVRRYSSDLKTPTTPTSPMFGATFVSIVKNRLGAKGELATTLVAFLISILVFACALWAIQISLRPGNDTVTPTEPTLLRSFAGATPAQEDDPTGGGHVSPPQAPTSGQVELLSNGDIEVLERSMIERFYKHRIGLYIIDKRSAATNSSSTSPPPNFYLEQWNGNPKLAGVVPASLNESDAIYVSSLIQDSKDQVAVIVFFDPQLEEATVLFEPHLPHAMLAGIKSFIDYRLSLKMVSRRRQQQLRRRRQQQPRDGVAYKAITTRQVAQAKRLETSQYNFHQTWHEIIQGFLVRRFLYGLGLATAEGIAIGVLVLAPFRHRSESRALKVRTTYWFAMAAFDLTLSLILVLGYTLVIVLIEQTHSLPLLGCIFLVLFIYKLASLPIPYLVSMIADSAINGFVFILLMNFTVGWVFAVNLRSFIEYTLSEGYLFTITSWLILVFPISGLIASMTDINHLYRIDQLCGQVPAYAATSNLVRLEGIQRGTIVDKLLLKVQECLANGKSGVSISVLHHQKFGILWEILLILVFGIIVWSFLMFSERVFGLIARRFNSQRTSHDPLKTIIRSTEPTNSLFKWDREKDRLVSEYIRCINEAKYVKQMVSNCLYLRIWLRPMGDQSTIDRRMALIMEPLIGSGLPKNDIQIELKTTLQIFIRIGSESNRCKLDRIQLIELYTKFIKEHGDMVSKFAVVDWTRETLYKILLHGHYNTKSTSAVT